MEKADRLTLAEAISELKASDGKCAIRDKSGHLDLRVSKIVHPHDNEECIVFEKRIHQEWVAVTEPCIPLDNWKFGNKPKFAAGDLVKNIYKNGDYQTIKRLEDPSKMIYEMENGVLWAETSIKLILTAEELKAKEES